ncbi:MAG: DnaJ domain-containing protein [Alkalinema sp. FL-bin-369]|nr:DnaJ domain-containing protein [Leptolyngbyaceae cyanobacterium LF-bin-369]
MVFQIQRGLFSTEFADHYALLGVPITADSKEVRKSYLKIARRLHPDSTAISGTNEKQLAEQLLSKFINPAWECLSQDKPRVEYSVIMKMKGQGAAAGDNTVVTTFGPYARSLFVAPDVDLKYRSAVQELSEKQYEVLNQAEELTAQLSELNLVYLMKMERRTTATSAQSTSPGEAASTPDSPPSSPSSNPYAARKSLAEPYFNRAELAFKRQNYAQAILELRDALKLEPSNSRFHALLGMVYLEQKQGTMARIHFDKALGTNPDEPMALLGKQTLQKMTGQVPATAGGKANSKAATGSKDGKSGGLFGGLFGKKK